MYCYSLSTTLSPHTIVGFGRCYMASYFQHIHYADSHRYPISVALHPDIHCRSKVGWTFSFCYYFGIACGVEFIHRLLLFRPWICLYFLSELFIYFSFCFYLSVHKAIIANGFVYLIEKESLTVMILIWIFILIIFPPSSTYFLSQN